MKEKKKVNENKVEKRRLNIETELMEKHETESLYNYKYY